MCAAISSEGMVLHEPLFWLYNTESLITFLANLYGKLVPIEERWQGRQNVQAFIIIRDSVAFYSFATHPLLLYFPQLHRGRFSFFMDAELVWPPSIWTDVAPWCNICCMPGYIRRRLPEMGQTCQEICAEILAWENKACHWNVMRWIWCRGVHQFHMNKIHHNYLQK